MSPPIIYCKSKKKLVLIYVINHKFTLLFNIHGITNHVQQLKAEITVGHCGNTNIGLLSNCVMKLNRICTLYNS